MGKFSDYKLQLASLPVGEHTFTYHLDKQFFANMEADDIRDAEVEVTLTLQHRRDAYDLTFHLLGTLTVPCDRCLDDLELPVDTSYHVVVKYGDDYRDEDEYMEIPASETSLNVAYMVYDTAVLAIPMKHVHPLGKCNRAMTSLLKKHRAPAGDDPDAELEDQLIDEMEASDAADSTSSDGSQDNE